MIQQTMAILLRRNPLKEYDEKLVFLTESFGLIQLISYGSKSKKSQRGKILSQLCWLKIMIEQQNGYLRLKEIKDYSPILKAPTNQKHLSSFDPNSFQFYLDFSHFIKETSLYLPTLNPTSPSDLTEDRFKKENSYFKLLRVVSEPEIQNLSSELRKFVFYFSFLQEHGVLGQFNGCQKCRTSCEDHYYFLTSDQVQKNYLPKHFDLHHQADFFCSTCLATLQSKQMSFFKISLSVLIILNLFIKRYQLDLNFFKTYAQFLKSQNYSLEQWAQLKKLRNAYKKFIF